MKGFMKLLENFVNDNRKIVNGKVFSNRGILCFKSKDGYIVFGSRNTGKNTVKVLKEATFEHLVKRSKNFKDFFLKSLLPSVIVTGIFILCGIGINYILYNLTDLVTSVNTGVSFLFVVLLLFFLSALRINPESKRLEGTLSLVFRKMIKVKYQLEEDRNLELKDFSSEELKSPGYQIVDFSDNSFRLLTIIYFFLLFSPNSLVIILLDIFFGLMVVPILFHLIEFKSPKIGKIIRFFFFPVSLVVNTPTIPELELAIKMVNKLRERQSADKTLKEDPDFHVEFSNF